MEINGMFDLSSNNNTFLKCNCWCDDNDNLSARVLCDEQYTAPERVIEYVKNGRSKLDEDGLFLAVVYFNEKLFIFADSTTSQWVLYYTEANGVFYYSTSLKTLLKTSGIERELNFIAAKGFLHNGIVLGHHTLVKNVYKLDACEMLVINNRRISKKRIHYSRLKKGTNANLISTLRCSIERYTEKDKRVFMPLSSGYDSNFILNTLVKSNHEIDAFTIGGEEGKNEISDVTEIIKNYSNVTHHINTANQSLFQKFPEIIWRLDGYVYERGIFLQYSLAELVAKNNGKRLICGECSDEHQHLLYVNEYKRYLSESVSPLEVFNGSLQLFSQGNYIVMKKSSLMLNSFGINSCYPFATKRFTDVASRFGKKNLDKKLYYIESLKKELPDILYKLLVHTGGSTSIESIVSESNRKMIKDRIESSDLINKIKNQGLICYKPFILNFYELFLQEKGRITTRVIIGYMKYLIKVLLKKINLYTEYEVPIKESFETEIKSYYLILFSELFLTEKFDLLITGEMDVSELCNCI